MVGTSPSLKLKNIECTNFGFIRKVLSNYWVTMSHHYAIIYHMRLNVSDIPSRVFPKVMILYGVCVSPLFQERSVRWL